MFAHFDLPLLFALCSNIAFATGSLLFTHFTKRTSSQWMNFYKAGIATIGFTLVISILQLWPQLTLLSNSSTLQLMISGTMGLAIGDIFLLKAFAQLGSGRVLMLFGFQPFILGLFSYLLFNQEFPLYRLFAVILLLGCLFSFALESFRTKGHWDQQGFVYAFIGIFLDAAGILLTRNVFDHTTELSPFIANWLRALTATVFFIILAQIPKFHFHILKTFKNLSLKEKSLATVAGFLGTFLSLSFYLFAVQMGHLATISAIAGTSPLFATLIETIFGRKKVTKYLVAGIFFFISGLIVLILN